MTRNDDGHYTHRGWGILPEHQEVNGRHLRKGLWLCFAPGAQSVTFRASTLQAVAAKIAAAMKEGTSNEQ